MTVNLSSQLSGIDIGQSVSPLYANDAPIYPLPETTSALASSNQVDFPQMNLNNVVGLDLQDVSMDFDWGFWGDPVDLATIDYTS